MALTGTYTDQFGVTHNEAYARVLDAGVDKQENIARINVAIYASEQARTDGKEPLKRENYQVKDTEAQGTEGEEGFVEAETNYTDYFSVEVMNAEGANVISQAYAYLKNINWDGWVDC